MWQDSFIYSILYLCQCGLLGSYILSYSHIHSKHTIWVQGLRMQVQSYWLPTDRCRDPSTQTRTIEAVRIWGLEKQSKLAVRRPNAMQGNRHPPWLWKKSWIPAARLCWLSCGLRRPVGAGSSHPVIGGTERGLAKTHCTAPIERCWYN